MIKIKHTQGIIPEKDIKKIPEKFFAKHSNGIEWTFFETQEEYDDYKKTLPVVVIEETKEENPLLTALKQFTPGEIEEIKILLNK